MRTILAALWGVSLALYLAAKIHFFTRYDPLGVGGYLQKHHIYWLAMAVTGLLIWLLAKRFPQNRQ